MRSSKPPFEHPSCSRFAPLLVMLVLAACSGPPEPTATAPITPSASSAPAAVTAFEGARVIVGDTTAPIENATLVVSGNRFVGVGRAGEVEVPAGAARVSLAGKTVMPAIVDTHTHLSRERAALIQDLRRRAYFGVSAAMSLGQDDGTDVFEVRGETIPGAALYRTAGRGITTPEPGRTDIPYWVTTVEEARNAVREQAALAVDIVKIWVDDRNGMYEKLSPELYTAVIDEAHDRGVRVTAHIFYLADAKALLRAGLDAFAHGIRDTDVDDEVLALFRERPDVVVVPNLPDRGVATDLTWLRDSIPAPQWQELQAAASADRPEQQAAHAIQARNLARLSAAGVKIALGTDGNVPWGPHLEMADMVAAGMTPAQVITASTQVAAELLRFPDAGTVAAGKSADFVVLTANPLDDIANTRAIEAVYLRGDRVDRDAVRARW
jgi:imidazolonepropionase-like amidohydrolase